MFLLWLAAFTLALGEAERVCAQAARRLPPLVSSSVRQRPAPEPEILEPPAANLDSPWWESVAAGPLQLSPEFRPVDVESLILEALRFSPRVRAISDGALIRETAIFEAKADFDAKTFMDSKFNRGNDPVGSSLTTGGPGRLLTDDWYYSAGMKKRTARGGALEASQRIGIADSNSRFFLPTTQGNSKMTLSFTQPLLNGAGRTYNERLIVLAQIDTAAGWDRLAQELQEHLVQVVEVYWELRTQRVSLVQKQRHLERGRVLLEDLRSRRELDALESQIIRAEAAETLRKTELIRAAAAIRNLEARLRALVASPEMLANRRMEIVPTDQPARELIQVGIRDAVIEAMENRPEVDEATQQIRAAGVRIDVARAELRPRLDMIVQGYVAGLDGDYDLGNAFVRQFSAGGPGYSGGLVFDMPLGNQAARARYQKRQLELRQLTSQFHAIMETLAADVETAVREVETSYREMQARHESMRAAGREAENLHERWRLLPGDDRSGSFLLQDLLDSQDRLSREEQQFAESQRLYTISLIRLKRATGTLLQHESITPQRVGETGLPAIILDKP